MMVRLAHETTDEADFADLAVPLTVLAADLTAQRSVALNEGPVADALITATTMPGLYPPVRREEERLVDALRAAGAASAIAGLLAVFLFGAHLVYPEVAALFGVLTARLPLSPEGRTARLLSALMPAMLAGALVLLAGGALARAWETRGADAAFERADECEPHQGQEGARVGPDPPVERRGADGGAADRGELVGGEQLHGRRPGERDHQCGQLDQPSAPHHGVDETRRQCGQGQQQPHLLGHRASLGPPLRVETCASSPCCPRPPRSCLPSGPVMPSWG